MAREVFSDLAAKKSKEKGKADTARGDDQTPRGDGRTVLLADGPGASLCSGLQGLHSASYCA